MNKELAECFYATNDPQSSCFPLLQASHAQDYETAQNLLAEHTPISSRRKSFVWHAEISAINERCRSRSGSINSSRNDMVPFKRGDSGSGTYPLESAQLRGRSLLSSSQVRPACV